MDELDSRIGSMTIADVSPRVAVKRIILLYENFQYREAANFINRLSHGTFKVSLQTFHLFRPFLPPLFPVYFPFLLSVLFSDCLNVWHTVSGHSQRSSHRFLRRIHASLSLHLGSSLRQSFPLGRTQFQHEITSSRGRGHADGEVFFKWRPG